MNENAASDSVTLTEHGEKNSLTDQEKLAKRYLRLAVFWRSFLFWMSFPLGGAISYFFQPEAFRACTKWAEYIEFAAQAVFMWFARMLVSLILLFKGEMDKVPFDVPYHHRIVLVTILITMIICIVIGRRFVRNAKTAISLVLSKEKVVEITERVEQGILYMKKDSDTFGGSVKRQLKQVLFFTLIIAACIGIVLMVVWIMN